MPTCLYVSLTMALYSTIIVCSLVISELGVIFDIIGAFGFGATGFVFPAIFYLLNIKKSENTARFSDKEICWNKLGSIFLLFFAIINIGLVLTKIIIENSTTPETEA